MGDAAPGFRRGEILLAGELLRQLVREVLTTITSGQSQLDNIKLALSTSTVSSATTINSLILSNASVAGVPWWTAMR